VTRPRVRFVSRSRAAAILAAAAIGGHTPAAAQPAEPSPTRDVVVVPVIVDATRAESWSFFAPRPGGGDPTYGLLGNRSTLGIAVRSRRFEFYGAFQYAQLLGLPRRAVGPGPLGPGALYYDAARAPNAYQLYFKALSVRLRDLGGGVSVEVGRMPFASGAEARAASSELEWLKRERLHSRLLGEVEWSAFGRGFDGIRVDASRPRWQATGALLFPVQGAFEESANATMRGVRVAAAALTLWTERTARPDSGPIARLAEPGARLGRADLAARETASRTSELQLFVQQYRDRRSDRARPDNDGLEAVPVDVDVRTVGASLAHLAPVRGGRFDAVVWLAAQGGDWYGDRHRALSLLAEGGFQWSRVPARPWLRAGLLWASGDEEARDRVHGTFFPVLPSMRPSLLAGTVAQMNLRDLWGELRLQPWRRLDVRADLHRLSLVRAADRWYSGTGATTFTGTYFGYTGRGSGGATSLGTLVQARIASPLTRRWSIRGSLGVFHGGAVVRTWFAGDRLTVVALESLVAF
jgi:hypothetical protein